MLGTLPVADAQAGPDDKSVVLPVGRDGEERPAAEARHDALVGCERGLPAHEGLDRQGAVSQAASSHLNADGGWHPEQDLNPQPVLLAHGP